MREMCDRSFSFHRPDRDELPGRRRALVVVDLAEI
jgi:hypothetical protein